MASTATVLSPLGFYLAGGIALTLQLGHRQSVDLALFRQELVERCLLAEQRIPLGALPALAVLMRARPEER
ncbi:MAG TPA: hypothetical protein VNL71_14565, partial [Chloroflexota bacterium]|nr:hypothetical protein [Chloroflexota bacterium]